MLLGPYNAACAALPATFKVVQWHGSHVWKVGDAAASKVFAIGTPLTDADDAPCGITLKVGLDLAPILLELDGVGGAPHLARGGWIKVQHPSLVDDETLTHHLGRSHALMAGALTRKKRADLGLEM